MIKIVGFDWSGTLSDDRNPVYHSNQLLMEHYRLPPISYIDLFQSTESNVVESMQALGVTDSPGRIIANYERFYRVAIEEEIHPVIYSDAEESLRYLRDAGKYLFVLSSHPQEFLSNEVNGLGRFFSEIIGSCHNKYEALKRIIEQAKVRPEECMYIGDSISDIRAGKNAGMRTIAITTGYHTREMLEETDYDYIVDSLSELEDLPVFME